MLHEACDVQQTWSNQSRFVSLNCLRNMAEFRFASRNYLDPNRRIDSMIVFIYETMHYPKDLHYSSTNLACMSRHESRKGGRGKQPSR